MSEIRLLLVDDEEFFRESVGKKLSLTGYAVESAGTLEEARGLLRTHTFHVALLDMQLPDGSGLDLLSEIKETSPSTEVILLTAYATVEEAIRAMKQGAHDFLTKLERNQTALERQVERLQPSTRFVGQSAQVRDLQRLIERVAPTDSTVLIRGKSGVGKEMVANAIHRQSPRARQPFVVVDCASLHENLLQSELFGHEKGAYTGAISLKHGLFEVADRGTIFLDEIGEITPPLQVKLLRVLETGTFRRLGGTVDIRVDVRVIAATNRSLEGMMKEGGFREDLYYRLNVFAITIPPLRERRNDIPLLVEHFIHHSSIASKRAATVSAEAMEALSRYPWPGNVRELKNVIEHALILCDGDEIERQHLPMGIRMGPSFGAEDEATGLLTLEEAEKSYIRRVLHECKGHRQKAAHILGISERTLYRKLQEIGEIQPS
ncbi:MAG: sigma-54-dependent Fis family transcriptional regulator [Candidatus Eisenbacteria bacterium]|nr:sigma-54-dependent Fis family transcriptional regulator [Candidatus Eisenbacteria bacterium]